MIPFGDVEVGRRFKGVIEVGKRAETLMRIPEYECDFTRNKYNSLILHKNSTDQVHIADDVMVTLLDACVNCEHYEGKAKIDYVDYCRIVEDRMGRKDDEPRPYSKRQDPKTFRCSNFTTIGG